ncbi:hypothetical protein F511_24721 [Dorcoceras hygrometricum]|uniref:Uncharacterized protein n=1 Tax=Dorcoceras hygrometricum TaxID=472368 RepID=A0A2Z7C701_9LAMI|nr:hypothetical protein F511_24721 [Dorcoceras hygrometricum]
MMTLLGIRITPPGGAAEEQKQTAGRRSIRVIQNSMTFIGCSKSLPCWHLCLAPTGITITRLFSVDCGRLRQSGPRPETRFLRQPALEELTRSARTDSSRQVWPEQILAKRRRRAAAAL